MTNDLDDIEDSSPGRQPERSNKGRRIVSIIGFSYFVCLLCCGGATEFYFIGSREVTGELRNELKVNPVVQDKVGNLRELDIDWSKFGPALVGEDLVLRIVGDKARGHVTVESITNDDGHEEVVSGTLELDSGESFDLFPEADSQEAPVQAE